MKLVKEQITKNSFCSHVHIHNTHYFSFFHFSQLRTTLFKMFPCFSLSITLFLVHYSFPSAFAFIFCILFFLQSVCLFLTSAFPGSLLLFWSLLFLFLVILKLFMLSNVPIMYNFTSYRSYSSSIKHGALYMFIF